MNTTALNRTLRDQIEMERLRGLLNIHMAIGGHVKEFALENGVGALWTYQQLRKLGWRTLFVTERERESILRKRAENLET